jgi:hypothetical protein
MHYISKYLSYYWSSSTSRMKPMDDIEQFFWDTSLFHPFNTSHGFFVMWSCVCRIMTLNYRLISCVIYISRCNSCCEHQELQYFSSFNRCHFLLLFKFVIQLEEQALLLCFEASFIVTFILWNFIILLSALFMFKLCFNASSTWICYIIFLLQKYILNSSPYWLQNIHREKGTLFDICFALNTCFCQKVLVVVEPAVFFSHILHHKICEEHIMCPGFRD